MYFLVKSGEEVVSLAGDDVDVGDIPVESNNPLNRSSELRAVVLHLTNVNKGEITQYLLWETFDNDPSQ